jgi:hypothetical protein
MRKIQGDLFELAISNKDIDAFCFPTNQNYSLDGKACMNEGHAKLCVERYPATAIRLGKCLRNFGTNVPFVIGAIDGYGGYLEPNIKMIKGKQFKALIFSFPTINNLSEGVSLELIKRSAQELINMANRYDLMGIALACAEGREIIENILDHRFVAIN